MGVLLDNSTRYYHRVPAATVKTHQTVSVTRKVIAKRHGRVYRRTYHHTYSR